MQAMAASNGNGGSTQTVRISGPGDLVAGAGSLIAAGARKVQGVRNALVGSDAGSSQGSLSAAEQQPQLRSAASMPHARSGAGWRDGSEASRSVHGGEEYHGRLLHYAAVRGSTPQPSLSTSPLRCVPDLALLGAS